MNIKELDKLFKDKVGDYFEQNNNRETTEDLLQLMVEMNSKIVYCCMDEENQLKPKQAAQDFGNIIAKSIERTAASVNTLKQVHKIFGMPLPEEKADAKRN